MRLPPERATIFARWIERIGEAWARAVPIPLRIDAASLSLVELAPFLRSLGPSFCCGRSLYAGAGRGVGGWLLPHRAADRLACAIGGLPPPPPHASASIGGPLDAGLEQIHGLFLAAWNRSAPPEWRLSEEITERSIQRFSGSPPPRVAAELPGTILAATIEVEGNPAEVGLLLPPALLGEPAANAPLADHPDHPVPLSASGGAPLAIADPSGELVRWLCAASREGRVECVSSPFPSSGAPSAATLVVGGAPGAHPLEFVTIRPRRS
jgi:hypothetical protein